MNRKFFCHGDLRRQRDAMTGIEPADPVLFQVSDGLFKPLIDIEEMETADDADDSVVIQDCFCLFDDIADTRMGTAGDDKDAVFPFIGQCAVIEYEILFHCFAILLSSDGIALFK